ncbi:MAG: CoB--CoM heterodisulfide reductase iron-sulfur subunit B family protein [Lachnospiraceae bacterium]|nr:CoB--CoM heterodisulfide reductase iron-sulfur subunit B family protein [Lachnospiraceae bacterium]
MVYSYFPGCTLKNKARDLDEYGRRSAEALGATLEEIPEWQCCGGVYPLSHDEIAIKLSSVRALADAQKKDQALVTVCSACHNVIKQVNNDMATDEYIATRANNYLKADGIEYHGETKVIHYLELLRDEIGFDQVKAAVKNPLKGKKIGAYYGCLLLRPSNVMAMDNAENPTIIEDLISALGADAVSYAQRNECCGGYLTLEDKSIPEKRVAAILADAKHAGAEMLVTACPLCYYNLKKHAEGTGIEIVYFTEVLAEALGVKEAGKEDA